jgi:hypothetical protein
MKSLPQSQALVHLALDWQSACRKDFAINVKNNVYQPTVKAGLHDDKL